jgi:hypothetical protein
MLKSVALSVSVILNLALALLLVYVVIEGTPEIANGKIGVLKQDLEIGRFGDNKTIFMLPKGLLVRDASAYGMGWFEPHRFRLVVTSGNKDLVDYSGSSTAAKSAIEGSAPSRDGELYSADVSTRRKQTQ